MTSGAIAYKVKKSRIILTFAEVIIALVVLALIAGIIVSAGEVIKISKLRAQITQIQNFDSAVARFYDKYEGLPGDLLSVSADRLGLPAGDGTPSHSDGDGKISPCNPGWQFNIGCETALFWAQLAATGQITGNFTADSRLSDQRLKSATIMIPYLPESPLGDGIYLTIWNTDEEQESPKPRLPYGNYFEITRFAGVFDEKIKESDVGALTPSEAYAIDRKMDDGLPYSGRMMINGGTTWPGDVWGTLAKPGERECVSAEHRYNTGNYFWANLPLCHMAVEVECCNKISF